MYSIYYEHIFLIIWINKQILFISVELKYCFVLWGQRIIFQVYHTLMHQLSFAHSVLTVLCDRGSDV